MQLLLGILNINYVEYKLCVQNPNSKIIDMVKQIEVSGKESMVTGSSSTKERI